MSLPANVDAIRGQLTDMINELGAAKAESDGLKSDALAIDMTYLGAALQACSDALSAQKAALQEIEDVLSDAARAP